MEKNDFSNTKGGWQKRWISEIDAASRRLRTFHQRAEKTVERYLDKRQDGDSYTHLNLFTSNVNIQKAIMYGQLPKVHVKRTYQDPDDDIARIASLIMERALNNDIQDNGEEYETVLKQTLEDRLVPGLGVAKLRYAAAFDDEDNLQYEYAPCEYFHWRDVLWGWSRTWADIPWIGFRSYLNREEVKERFGADALKTCEFSNQAEKNTEHEGNDSTRQEHEEKAEFWEIWDSEEGCVFWVNTGMKVYADKKEDPLELNGFYPCPPFLAANCSTSLYEPLPDFYLAQDLYNEIDKLETRIVRITKAVKVAGAYDASQGELQRIMQETTDNDLVPVENWGSFSEKGGLDGVIDWVPLQEVVNALQTLEQVRDSKIQLLYEIIGISDIMRGAGQKPGSRVTGEEQRLKAHFGSTRIQAMQDEFSRFAADMLQIKAEIMSRHFDPQSIMAMGTVQGLAAPDLMKLDQAMALIKDYDTAQLRVKIRSDSLAMLNYQEMKSDRMEYLMGLSQFLQSSAPLMEARPEAAPFLMELLKWGLTAYKGGNEVEGIIDQAIDAAKNAPPPQQDDGKAAEIQAKAEAESRKTQEQLQADVVKIREKLQADLRVIAAKASAESQKEVTQAIAARIEELGELEAKLTEIDASSKAKIREIKSAPVRTGTD